MKQLENDLILAPMAGYTDIGFKCLCEKYGASITISEMVSAKAIKFNSDKTKKLLYNNGLNKIKGAQIFGNDPIIMSDIINDECFNDYDFIDINMGCPAPKIVKNKEGSYLLNDINLSSKIISSCVEKSKKPVTVKFRIGYTNDKIIAKEFAKMCEESGAKLITVHGRTTEQKYMGKANLDVIHEVKESVKIKVCGNGDVKDKQSYNLMKQTGVDFVMIGRGAIGNPYAFSEILGKDYNKNLLEDITFHYKKLSEIYSERVVLNNMKKHLALYLKGLEKSREILNELFSCTTINKSIKILTNYFKNEAK